MPTIEPLSPRLVEEFKTVRLRALKDTPTAFGSTYAKESAFSDGDWLKRMAGAVFAISAWMRVPRVGSSRVILTRMIREGPGLHRCG
jgi:hypothetical protein